MMHLTDQEKLTLITTTEADHDLVVSTYNPDLKAALQQFSRHNPAFCSLHSSNEEGQETYLLVKASATDCFLPLVLQNYMPALVPIC